MKRLLLIAFLWLLPSAVFAQCNGVFQPHTVCGNNGASPDIPGQVPQASIIGPGGSDTQIQYNNSGFFGGLSDFQVGTRLAVPVSILTIGGVADSSSAYNASNATTNANALASMSGLSSGRCILFPANTNGYSLAANTVAIGTSQCLIGENQVKIKSQPTSSGWVLHVTSQELFAGPAIIQNLTIDTNGATSGTSAIRFATTSQTVYGVQISQLLCLNAFECVGDETSASNYVFDIKLYDIRSILTQGRSFHISRSRGFMWLDTIRVDQQEAGQTAPAPWNCAEFNDVIGLEINRYDCVGPTTALGGSYSAGKYGLLIQGTGGGQASVWLNRILIDSYTNDGIKIDSVNYLQANWLESFQNLGVPLTLTNIGRSNISNTLMVGGVGVTGAVTAIGITCTTCIAVNFNGVVTINNKGTGMNVGGGSIQVGINNFQSFGNSLFGLSITDTADLVTFDNGGMSGNTSGGVSNTSSGTANRITNLAGYNPIGSVAAVNVGASPATICAGADSVTDYLFQSATNTAAVFSGANEIQVLATTQFYPINLLPGECYTVTWATTQPTYTRVKH